MWIGELAKQGGVTVQTVRFYERKNLLPPPGRRPSGYHIYSGDDLHRLRFIRQAKVLGFSLDEIREPVKGEACSIADWRSCFCDSRLD
jgi:DNA-binding transcriptional MerR regulator